MSKLTAITLKGMEILSSTGYLDIDSAKVATTARRT